MNERQLEKLEELRDMLSNSIGQYGYTDKYSLETKENNEDYAIAEVTIALSIYNKEKREHEDKEIYISFEIYEDNIKIVLNEDNTEQVDICNFNEWIWRKMFFEK